MDRGAPRAGEFKFGAVVQVLVVEVGVIQPHADEGALLGTRRESARGSRQRVSGR